MKISKLRENTDSDVLNQDGYYPGSKSGNDLFIIPPTGMIRIRLLPSMMPRVFGMITVTPAAEVLLTWP